MSLVDSNSLSVVPYVHKSSEIEQSRLYMHENLKARMQSVMNDSFKAQLLDYKNFHQYGMGDIVVLVGTSTAGKTSIIKALKQLESMYWSGLRQAVMSKANAGRNPKNSKPDYPSSFDVFPVLMKQISMGITVMRGIINIPYLPIAER